MAPFVYYAPTLSRIAVQSVCGVRPLIKQQAARIVIQEALWSPGTWSLHSSHWRVLNSLRPSN